MALQIRAVAEDWPIAGSFTISRGAKTEAKVGQRAAVDLLSVSLPEEVASSFDAGRADLADAGSISEIETAAGATLEVSVRLADGE